MGLKRRAYEDLCDAQWRRGRYVELGVEYTSPTRDMSHNERRRCFEECRWTLEVREPGPKGKVLASAVSDLRPPSCFDRLAAECAEVL